MRWRKIPELWRLKTLRWVLAGLLSTGVIWAIHEFQQHARADAELLPVTFAHTDHQGVNCASCHHEFIDDTGRGQCIACHTADNDP